MYYIGGDNINNKIAYPILFILILFLFISFVGAASAANNSSVEELNLENSIDENLPELLEASGDGDNLKASGDDEILTANVILQGNSFSDLRQAIQDANAGDVIYIGNKTLAYDGQGTINVYKGVTISGGNPGDNTFSTLDGQGSIRLMELNAAGITLQNIRFVNGHSDGQAGAVMITQPNAQISNCIFEDNVAREGGAIYATNTATGATIEDSSFTGNTGQHAGGAIKIEWTEGCVIDNCDFIDNHVYDHYQGEWDDGRDVSCGGGAIWSCNSETIVRDSTFIGNNASFGGALRGAFDIEDSYFERNVAEWGNGGAIDVTCIEAIRMSLNLEFENSTFVNNTAKGPREDQRAQGGAIHIFDINSVNMTGCTCVNNTADRGGGVDFYQMRVTHVENCTFDNNNATNEGGGVAIFCNDNTFKDVEVSNNNAGTYGGAIWIIGNNTLFDNVTSIDNTATIGGSAYVEGDHTTLQNSVLDGNKASQNGGGAYISGDDVTVQNCIVSDNTAGSEGGAVYVYGDNAVFDNITSRNNTARYEGGAFRVFGDDVTVSDSTLTDNGAMSGGAISIDGDRGTFTNNNISSNKASSGGAIYVAGSDTTFTDNEITSNAATFSGGAIYVDGENTNFTHNNISDNTATFSGGGVYVDGQNTYFEDIIGDNNTANNGGFGAISDATNLIVKDSTFTNNHAIGDYSEDEGLGGAFHISGANPVDIQANFYNNTAVNGSAIYVEDSTLRVHDSEFFDNQAYTFELDIYPENGTGFNSSGDKIVTITHIGGDNIANAIHSDGASSILINNITYPFYNGTDEIIKTTPAQDMTPVEGYENSENGEKVYRDDRENNQVIYYRVVDISGVNETIIRSGENRSAVSGNITLNLTDLPPGKYRIDAWYVETPYYTANWNMTAFFEVIQDTCNVTVKKIWDDNDNQDGFRPVNVTVQLLADGEVINSTVLSNATGWNYTFTNLPVSKEGVDINYTISEVSVANYTANITSDGNGNWTINNTHIPELTSVNVTKVWNDDNNQDGLRPVNVTVQLLADGIVVNSTVLSNVTGWNYTHNLA